MATDRIPMSKEGYEKLKAQLDKYKNEDMPRIAEQIAEARGEGDLSENAEFDAAVEAQGMLQARINELQNKLSQAFIVDKSTLPTERAAFGLKVRVLDLDVNEEEDYILVGPGEEDPDQDKIPITGPIGQALVGKKVGEQVEVPVPRGVRKLKVVSQHQPEQSRPAHGDSATRPAPAPRAPSASGGSDAGSAAIVRAARSRAAA